MVQLFSHTLDHIRENVNERSETVAEREKRKRTRIEIGTERGKGTEIETGEETETRVPDRSTELAMASFKLGWISD